MKNQIIESNWYSDLAGRKTQTQAGLDELVAWAAGKCDAIVIEESPTDDFRSKGPSTLMHVRPERYDSLTPLEYLVREAGERGIEVGLKVICARWRGSALVTPWPSSWNLSSVNPTGGAWLNFHIPEARQALAAIVADYLAQLPVLDFVYADFMRYWWNPPAPLSVEDIYQMAILLRQAVGSRELYNFSTTSDGGNCRPTLRVLNEGIVDAVKFGEYATMSFADRIAYIQSAGLPVGKIYFGVGTEIFCYQQAIDAGFRPWLFRWQKLTDSQLAQVKTLSSQEGPLVDLKEYLDAAAAAITLANTAISGLAASVTNAQAKMAEAQQAIANAQAKLLEFEAAKEATLGVE